MIDVAIIWIKYTPHLLYSLRVQDFIVQVDKQQKTPLYGGRNDGGMARHNMSNKDIVLRTAICSICGPVKINIAGRCRNAINKDKTKSRRTKGVKRFKRGNQSKNRSYVRKIKEVPCMDCGILYPFYVMDLDHRDPSIKHKSVSQMMKHPYDMVIEEVSKCDVVCSNCHRERTWGKNKRTRKKRV